jgi:hypothetical protein
MSIQFVPSPITITVKQDGHISEQTVDGMLAESTGLAYLLDSDDEGQPHHSIIHVASKSDLGSPWGMGDEHDAQTCIALLDVCMDWTPFFPRVRSQKGLAILMNVVTIGAIDLVTSEEPASAVHLDKLLARRETTR